MRVLHLNDLIAVIMFSAECGLICIKLNVIANVSFSSCITTTFMHEMKVFEIIVQWLPFAKVVVSEDATCKCLLPEVLF